MPKLFLPSLILLSLVATGCSLTNRDVISEPTVENEDTVLQDTVEENAIVQGVARLTKGDQIIINGIFLTQEQVLMTGLDELRLDGKNVELQGDINTHYCSLYDQCVGGEDGNYLKSVANVKYIKVINE